MINAKKKDKGKNLMKRPPKKWKCNGVVKTPEQMDLGELKTLLNICYKMDALCGWNEESYNQNLWIIEEDKVKKLIEKVEKENERTESI